MVTIMANIRHTLYHRLASTTAVTKCKVCLSSFWYSTIEWSCITVWVSDIVAFYPQWMYSFRWTCVGHHCPIYFVLSVCIDSLWIWCLCFWWCILCSSQIYDWGIWRWRIRMNFMCWCNLWRTRWCWGSYSIAWWKICYPVGQNISVISLKIRQKN